ncbi:helix-turn-helix domain-containing protein [Paenibacillus apiarius]|uniref:Helix-turn-helix domain-containing protein n=1 Tax=Paenibacillus apiarius TaxID=46240 RepID=A0ABT4DNP5_9BACL|nr:helix-turn-helix transcriptional regulator [Paenibacillus apiarius]MBN3525275.1 helix-turn-helix transcriptional regulator [Paenibacillus apiarius]MCY9512994.1 helix-turn-helix domain-containing protein [Paenibacillus apiarius]MCY9518978.1 helix-turn-helix domain-containing protein [Paenibacillus apiarius]MCY9550787.1 helix-turn-helix domain-containing protein [Paenibacillus apiarius]MCY9559779.1 helix-turn-helix domain-containing protein [Paenibacillus apiarius]
MADLKVFLGYRIRQLRKLKGYTQAELGDKCGMKASYIGGAERGSINISLDSLERMIRALDVSIEDFFAFDTANVDAGRLGIAGTLELHVKLLKGREPGDVKLVHRIAKDMLETFDRRMKH